MKQRTRTYLAAGMAAVITGAALPVAYGAGKDGTVQEDLGEVVVTATRSAKRDLEVPAATRVISAQEIRESGARNAAEALSEMDSTAYSAFGQNGAAMGTMSNDVVIRGIDNGTLILVNGNPVSWRGKYDLSAIPAGSIERIEVVKGGGSVLYGSEAMAGVINIITKKKADNQVMAGIGNSGQYQYHVNAGDDRLTVTYDFSQWKHGVEVSRTPSSPLLIDTKTVLHDVKKQSAGLSWQLTPNLGFLYQYLNTDATYDRWVTQARAGLAAEPGDLYNSRHYTKERHITQMNYKDKDWKGSFYFNSGTVESEGPTNFNTKTGKPAEASANRYNTREKNITYGLDIQRRWKQNPKDTWIGGMSLQREQMDKLYAVSTKTAAKYTRNNWAAFAQYEHAFDAKNSMTAGARETWTSGAWKDQNYHNFSMSGQWLHRMGEAGNLYASVAQSFIMPYFAQMYGASSAAVPNPDLKPQKGVNYEIGWKKKRAAHSWKAALFHMDITDNISASWESKKSQYEYSNEDFRNTGLELALDIKGVSPWSWHWGMTVQNPESKSTKKGYWDRKYGRLQLTGGVGFHQGKWTSRLDASFLAKRVQTPTAAHSFGAKPYLLTRWNTIFQPDERNEFSLTINNLLDRHDVISHGVSTYYTAPASFLFSYAYKF